MIERLIRDESGMTMSLAIATMVIVGVMGAGLLTFVSTDLNTVVEVNQGQRAFEMADAGVAAAKRQLQSDSSADKYNGGAGDVQWSSSTANPTGCPALGTAGICVDNLDGASATTDRVNVTIQYQPTPADSFKVISTGGYGNAKRKIEAVFKRTSGSGTGIKAYYTPGDIEVKDNVSFNGVSLFSGRDITIVNLPTNSQAGFRTDFRNNSGVLKFGSNDDPLEDWNTTDDAPPASWNTVGRTGKSGYPNPWDGETSAVRKPGLAAEGKICGSSSCGASGSSVADGVYGFDSTTGDKGDNLKFARKYDPPQCDPAPGVGGESPTLNPNSKDNCSPARDLITYPFDRKPPDAEKLKALAEAQGNYYDAAVSGAPGIPEWSDLFDDNNVTGKNQIVFVDAAGNGAIPFATDDSRKNQGILVMRCGNIDQQQNFKGIIIVLKGTSPDHGSGCSGLATYKNTKTQLQGYVYAEGDNPSNRSITIEGDSSNPASVDKLPSGWEDLLGLSGLGAATTRIELESWRELYQ